MTGFLTIMVLVCQLKSKDLYCYDKGAENLRGEEISKFVPFDYYKCTDAKYKDCSMMSKWDGCVYTMKDKTVHHSSYTCP